MQLADGLAENGLACFRFDMPGLGDSEGELPARHVDLYQLIQDGGHAPCAARLTQVLLETHKLDDMLLAGICGGAMTSIFAAAMLTGRVGGLILLDLPFFSVRPQPSAGSRQPSVSGIQTHTRRLAQWKAVLHDRILASRFEPQMTTLYHKMKRMGKALLPLRLPTDANLKLIEVLTALLTDNIPALLISARPTQQATPAFDYVTHIRQRCPRGLEQVEIAGTTHSFVENGGGRAVLETILKWLPRQTARRKADEPARVTRESFSPEYASVSSQ